MNRLAIFDCDGTLVDSGHTIHHALNLAMAEQGLPALCPAACRRIIGLSLVQAIAALLPAESSERHVAIAETYKAKFHAMRHAGEVSEPLFDGILDLLEALEADGWLLAVATGKSDRGLQLCLASHDIHARFVSLQTSDRHPSKPHPSMAQLAMSDAGAEPAATVVIGDTSYDMGMAKAAGAFGIGVTWGYHEPSELLASGAAAVADTPADVLAIARELVGASHER
ncbi:HAD-IA family hydrolase [Sphingomonas piscis]|uniref:HAD-IA family hydrolase n=1 Tax=Sphingomonas piscis TaxID=2714943 RepID=A0A6G7YP32_9SPHN|nr:HAD-IA family hydrolase [Sphingomonas piscis]QIK78486.1 HAD-IA family hydrolase [Sphingomonas piscis]